MAAVVVDVIMWWRASRIRATDDQRLDDLRFVSSSVMTPANVRPSPCHQRNLARKQNVAMLPASSSVGRGPGYYRRRGRRLPRSVRQRWPYGWPRRTVISSPTLNICSFPARDETHYDTHWRPVPSCRVQWRAVVIPKLLVVLRTSENTITPATGVCSVIRAAVK